MRRTEYLLRGIPYLWDPFSFRVDAAAVAKLSQQLAQQGIHYSPSNQRRL
jgi:hypothetical protein